MTPDNPPKTFPLRLPASVSSQAREAAKEEGISLNQFISLAIAEKIVRLDIKPATIRRQGDIH